MLPFFTDPYPNELIYSAISRYHFYNGNVNFGDTLKELFGKVNFFPNIEFGNYLSNMVQNLGQDYSVEKIILGNTIYPLFAPFITKEKQIKVIEDMSESVYGMKGRLGLLPSKVDKKKGIFFCTKCVIEDIERYGEPYLHREHHLPAIYYCPHHEQILRKYPIDYKSFSRIGYIRLDKRILDTLVFEDDNTDSEEFKEIQIQLSKMAYRLLQLPMNSLSLEVVYKKYRTLLRENNWIMLNIAVKQTELLKAFNAKFPEGFLEKFNSYLRGMGTNNWLQNAITNYKKQGIHPFRHLLLIYFFDQDIDSFLCVKEDEGPFGEGPWPCLNPVANHYKQLVISDVSINKSKETNVIIGRFKCSCGFEYTRAGPEKDESEKWIRSRIMVYGDVWESKFNELVKLNMQPEEIALMMEISESTVKSKISVMEKSPQKTEKYRKELLEWIESNPTGNRKQFQKKSVKSFTYLYKNDSEWLNAHLPSKRADTFRSVEERIASYRKLMTKEIKENPNITRSMLWKKYSRVCEILSENDRDWYEVNMPNPVSSIRTNNRIEWEARDEEYYKKVKQIYPDLLNLKKPVRITKMLFARYLGIDVLSDNKRIHKVPKTKALLDELTETVKEFQIRRCCLVIDQMLDKNGIVYFAKVRAIGALRSKDFKIIKPYLEKYILEKSERKEF